MQAIAHNTPLYWEFNWFVWFWHLLPSHFAHPLSLDPPRSPTTPRDALPQLKSLSPIATLTTPTSPHKRPRSPNKWAWPLDFAKKATSTHTSRSSATRCRPPTTRPPRSSGTNQLADTIATPSYAYSAWCEMNVEMVLFLPPTPPPPFGQIITSSVHYTTSYSTSSRL